jgi:hypothetical protein
VTTPSRAANTRSLGSLALATAYRIVVEGGEQVPKGSPLVVIAAGVGPLVGPIIATQLIRPVHMFGMPVQLGGLAPQGPDGGRQARTLLSGRAAVGLQGDTPSDHALAAFLALWSEAQILPIVVQGAHGRFAVDPPRLRSMVRMVVFPPFTLPAAGDPCAWPVVRDAAEQVRQVLADAERTVRRPLD